MDAGNKAVGSGGCQIVVGSDATPVKTGYHAWGLTVRTDDTQIKSVTKTESDTGVSSVVTDESWESLALAKGEYIALEDRITSITLNAAGDSVTLWLEKG